MKIIWYSNCICLSLISQGQKKFGFLIKIRHVPHPKIHKSENLVCQQE